MINRSLKTAGDELDDAIITYVRMKHALLLGQPSAEATKIAIGSAFHSREEKYTVVRGRDLEKGLPRTIRVSSVAIREALANSVSTIVNAVYDVIEDTPPELAADIAERGIVLCGGGSFLSGLTKLISRETKMPVLMASDPLSCVVVGTVRILDNSELLSKVKIASM